jgi:basic membrane protein A and related proteins
MVTRIRRAGKQVFSTAVHIPLARLVALAAAIASLSGIGCRADDAKTGAGAGPASDSPAALRVALLTPGPISDQSWNGGAYQGLMRIKDSLGATVSHIQTKTPAEFEEQFRQYGAQGFDLVFGHGFEFQDAAKRVGPDFPRTVYVITSSTATGPNVAGIEFAFADASYLAGMLAATMSTSEVIGVIGGTELPPVKESFDAFTRGAKAVKPGIAVLSSYIGNWDDVSAGREQALAQIGRRADVIFQNADAAGLGVFQAARETKKALVVGSNSNQNAVAPEITIASVVIDLPHAFLTVAREVAARTFKPRVIRLGTESEVVTLVVNPAFQSRIPAAALRAVDSMRTELRTGRFDATAAAAPAAALPTARP